MLKALTSIGLPSGLSEGRISWTIPSWTIPRERRQWNTGALLDRRTHHVHILEMNGGSYRLKHSRNNVPSQASEEPEDS